MYFQLAISLTEKSGTSTNLRFRTIFQQMYKYELSTLSKVNGIDAIEPLEHSKKQIKKISFLLNNVFISLYVCMYVYIHL